MRRHELQDLQPAQNNICQKRIRIALRAQLPSREKQKNLRSKTPAKPLLSKRGSSFLIKNAQHRAGPMEARNARGKIDLVPRPSTRRSPYALLQLATDHYNRAPAF